ncbi:MAG: hypothetical protein KJ063_23005, partial [Anaerolineae bacterium]|nr:hypothetical protein [Anaerolineae bacterium]
SELTAEKVMDMGERIIQILLQKLPPEERLVGLRPEERLIGLRPEDVVRQYRPEDLLRQYRPQERLVGLRPEEVLQQYSAEEIEAYLQQLKKQKTTNGEHQRDEG